MTRRGRIPGEEPGWWKKRKRLNPLMVFEKQDYNYLRRGSRKEPGLPAGCSSPLADEKLMELPGPLPFRNGREPDGKLTPGRTGIKPVNQSAEFGFVSISRHSLFIVDITLKPGPVNVNRLGWWK
jgi:hypothetical protein